MVDINSIDLCGKITGGVSEEVIRALEELVTTGEVLIRKSPLRDERFQVVWEAHRAARTGALADSIVEAILLTAAKLKHPKEIQGSE